MERQHPFGRPIKVDDTSILPFHMFGGGGKDAVRPPVKSPFRVDDTPVLTAEKIVDVVRAFASTVTLVVSSIRPLT
jgi:hypothetical protein